MGVKGDRGEEVEKNRDENVEVDNRCIIQRSSEARDGEGERGSEMYYGGDEKNKMVWAPGEERR